MSEKYFTRRKFLQFGGGGLSIFFLFKYFSNFTEKVKISFQSSFLPPSFKKSMPKKWKKQNINFDQIKLVKHQKKILDSDFILINDGWTDIINFENYQNFKNLSLLDKLDRRSNIFLNTFKQEKREKLFPIGVIPYALLIKSNTNLINAAEDSWNFLFSKNLTGKIIFPKSPRILISIAEASDNKDSLGKLKSQAMMYEDKNALNWLINSEACLAIVPYSLCYKYPKIDPRISIVFPKQGVPLMWYFILTKSKVNNEKLVSWINSLEKKSNIDRFSNQGWYLPFNNDYSQSKFNQSLKSEVSLTAPSKECWEKSWSLDPLDNQSKVNYEKLWNESLTP